MEEVKFDFVFLPDKKSILDSKSMKEYLAKWSMDSNVKVKFYNFNQPFGVQHSEEFVKAFFKSSVACSSLEVFNFSNWSLLCEPCDKVKIETVPCSITSMSFFDKITDPKNQIVRSEKGDLILKQEVKVDDFYSNDNLRACLIEEDSRLFQLYSEFERKEFIFKLLGHFALGGSLCQFEDNIKPYLESVKKVYKDLIAVTKEKDREEVRVRSLVLQVVAYINNKPVCPSNPENRQDFVYLIIDSFKRQLIVFMHHYTD